MQNPDQYAAQVVEQSFQLIFQHYDPSSADPFRGMVAKALGLNLTRLPAGSTQHDFVLETLFRSRMANTPLEPLPVCFFVRVRLTSIMPATDSYGTTSIPVSSNLSKGSAFPLTIKISHCGRLSCPRINLGVAIKPLVIRKWPGTINL
jgi:hypothetical protein